MSDKYKDSWRGYLIDHHSPDPPIQPLNNLDVQEWERYLNIAQVNCLMLYCKDHYGVAYYDTKVGRKHPGLKTDFIAEIAQVLKRLDIEFWAYYSVGFDLWAAKSHPDWAVRDEEGKVVRFQDKWPWVCGNTGYRDYILSQLEEILAYRPDSIFLDIVFTPLCYCASCKKRFYDQYGFEIPQGTEKLKKWRNLVEWYNEVLQYELFKTITDGIHRLDSSLPVSMNASCLHCIRKVQDLMTWTYAEPWAGNFISAGFARGTGIDPQMGVGQFQQVYNPYPPSVYISEVAGVASQGVRPFYFSGSLKPDGSLDRLEFEEVGAAYKEVKKFQTLLKDRDPIKEVGILYSESTNIYGLNQIMFRTDHLGLLDDTSYTEAIAGAIKASAVTKYPYELIPEWKLNENELFHYQVLVMPNSNSISVKMADLISDWVSKGGKLMATFHTSLKDEGGRYSKNFILAETFGVDYVGTDESYVGSQDYGSYLDDKVGPLWESLPATSLAVAPPMVQVKAKTADVLAVHTLPSCKVTPNCWVNWWSPPPAQKTHWPAVTLNKFGNGLVMYVSFDLFNMVRKISNTPFVWSWHFLKTALENVLLPNPSIRVRTDQPLSLNATYFKVRGKDQILVHLLNSTVMFLGGDVLPIPGNKLVIKDKLLSIKTAKVIYPDECNLEIKKEGDNIVVNYPSVSIHTILSLEG